MEFVTALKARLPEYAKDIRLNLDAVISRSSLTPQHAVGAALAAAVAAGRGDIVDAIMREALLEPAHQQAALTAAALMGMNNVWYPFVEMAGDADLKSMRAELRMNAYANHGGVDRSSFEALRARGIDRRQVRVLRAVALSAPEGERVHRAAITRRRPDRGGDPGHREDPRPRHEPHRERSRCRLIASDRRGARGGKPAGAGALRRPRRAVRAACPGPRVPHR